MDFSRIARQLNEGMESTEAAISSSEKAKEGGIKQKEGTDRRRQAQKSQMSQQRTTPVKSDVSFTSEEYKTEREIAKNLREKRSDWRQDLIEAAKPDEQGNHPYVDVMPFVNQKAMEAGRQMKDAARMEGGKQAKMASEEFIGEEESGMDKAMAFMRDKYKGALMSPNKEKKEISDEERQRRARNRAKFAKKEHDRLYGRKND